MKSVEKAGNSGIQRQLATLTYSDNAVGLVGLAELAQALKEQGYEPPKYRDCYTAASSARFPATRVRGRWYVHPRDYPAIAAALQLRKAVCGS